MLEGIVHVIPTLYVDVAIDRFICTTRYPKLHDIAKVVPTSVPATTVVNACLAIRSNLIRLFYSAG